VAQLNHDKGDKDMNMTKAKMDKLTGILRNKNNHAEECKNNYLLFLEETNKKQDHHYTSQMPEVMTVSNLFDQKGNLFDWKGNLFNHFLYCLK